MILHDQSDQLISQLMSAVKVLKLAGFVEIIMIQDGKPSEPVGLGLPGFQDDVSTSQESLWMASFRDGQGYFQDC